MNVVLVDRWLQDLFRSIDAMDAPTFARAFSEDGAFRFGNSDPALGREQASAVLQNTVTQQMAVLVVDLLEVVKIQQQQGER